MSNNVDIEEALIRARMFVENLDPKPIVYITKQQRSSSNNNSDLEGNEEDVICIDYTTNILLN